VVFCRYVTNGSLTEEALGLLAPHLDVCRADVKGFSSETYQQLAHLLDWGGILNVTARAKRSGMHVEVVTNIIPGFNDDEKQLMKTASWIRNCLGEDTPWHVTRFHPHLILSHLTPTPVPTLERARTTGLNAGTV
jgi:pyruvate formate lyase activating enzyme